MLDWTKVWALCDHKRKNEKTSFREIAKRLGLTSSGSSFTRMKAGKAIDADSFVILLSWLGVSWRAFIKENKK